MNQNNGYEPVNSNFKAVGDAGSVSELAALQQVFIVDTPNTAEGLVRKVCQSSWCGKETSIYAEKSEPHVYQNMIGGLRETRSGCGAFAPLFGQILCCPFKLHKDEAVSSRPFNIELEHGCQITYMCGCPNLTQVFYQTGSGRQLAGTIKTPCLCGYTCFDACCCEFSIEAAASGGKNYFFKKDFCQCIPHFCGAMCCDSCQKITYTISNTEKQPVGSITKLGNTCFTAMCCGAPEIAVKFPAAATPQEKALLLASALILSYLEHSYPVFGLYGGLHCGRPY